MSDQQTYTHIDGSEITISDATTRSDKGYLIVVTSYRGNAGAVIIPSARLLAMIDTVAPDAMRAYLRETSESAGHTVRVTPEQLDQTPVADSPEDVMPDHIDPTERAQLDRAWALDKAVTLFSAGIGSSKAITVADWIINGTEVTDR